MKITPHEAKNILMACHAYADDFHSFSSDTVTQLLIIADAHKYRAPKNANGSRARYFHAYLRRLMARDAGGA